MSASHLKKGRHYEMLTVTGSGAEGNVAVEAVHIRLLRTISRERLFH